MLQWPAWWVVAPITISVLALLVSAGSLWIAYLGYRRTARAEEPTASATVVPVPGQPQWVKVELTLKNRSPHGQRCERIEFIRPWTAKALRGSEAYAPQPDADTRLDLLDPLPLDQARRILDVDVTLAKAGTPAPMFRLVRMGPGDDHIETLFVAARWALWSRKVAMKVKLRSIEPIERTAQIVVVRTLPRARWRASA